MVPDNFLENNEPKTNKIDRKSKDLIDLNPVFIDDWSKDQKITYQRFAHACGKHA